MKVYLAGGLHSKWREQVTQGAPMHTYLDPTTHGLTEEKAYTQWDLNAIRDCAIVLAYMDEANPSGYGLSLEIGYATALNRVIIYVEENLTNRSKYFGMARVCATLRFSTLNEAIEWLRDN